MSSALEMPEELFDFILALPKEVAVNVLLAAIDEMQGYNGQSTTEAICRVIGAKGSDQDEGTKWKLPTKQHVIGLHGCGVPAPEETKEEAPVKLTDIQVVFDLLRPALEVGCYVTVERKYGVLWVDLNTKAKSECHLEVRDGKIKAHRRYGRVDEVNDFKELLILVHGCGHGRSYFSSEWERLLLANGFGSPRGEM